MSDSKSKQEIVNDPKIDAIKQIIFGDNIADYNQRFEELNQYIEDVKNDFDSQLIDLELKVNNAIAILREDYEKNVDRLENKLEKEVRNLEDKKVDRKSLAKMFSSVAEKLEG